MFIPTIKLPDTARDPWLGGTEFPKVFYYDDSKDLDGNPWISSEDIPEGTYTKDWRLDLWVSVLINGEKQLITYAYKKDQF